MRLLLVEDEDRIASFVHKGLVAHGYTVERVATGAEASTRAATREFDLLILDLGLPDVDGLDVLRGWRDRGIRTPVVILSARGEVRDRVEGLELGADDYLAKPFAFDELLARVRARLRPQPAGESTVVRFRDVELDLRTRRVTVGERSVDLAPREFSLLETFLRNPGQVLSREQLLSRVWGYDFDPQSNLVDVYVGYLRRKLGDGYIETVRGAGYRLLADA
ncbi:MAG TPA: response regulator transcription factor [Actinomycetota bacterium]|jgi:DNA-binding response OmpR family regulator